MDEYCSKCSHVWHGLECGRQSVTSAGTNIICTCPGQFDEESVKAQKQP